MGSGILAYAAASVLYGLLAVYFWRTRWSIATMPAGPAPAPVKGWESYAILAPLAIHGYSLSQSLFTGGGLNLGVGNAISAIVWLTVLIYWLANFFYNLEGMQALVTPVAAVGALLPALFPSLHPLPNTELAAFKAHLLIAMLAYSLLTIAALHALLMALVERRLHNAVLLANLPPLLTMETLLFRIILTGFILLTLTLVTGIAFSEELFGRPLRLNHKTVFAFISWGIFAALLTGRYVYGWRGRTAVRWTLAGFATLLLAYVGSKFVLEVILGRG